MGRCVFCAREFEASFLYCPFCGKRLRPPNRSDVKWYYSRYAVVFGLGTVGPFALPLVWFNPRYTALTKILLTVVILAVTFLLVAALALLYVWLLGMVEQLMSLD